MTSSIDGKENPGNSLGERLRSNTAYKVGELLLLFVLVIVFVSAGLPFAGENPIHIQFVVWLANILMLIYVWIGLKVRGQTWKDLGLQMGPVSWKKGIKTFLQSLLVFVLALVGFALGSVIMANITGIPEPANMTGYNYLEGNLGLLLLTLAAVYIVSSFGEEVIYRGFLINRISEIGNGSRTATWLAVVLSSVIFGLIHYKWGPMGMVQTGFMGLALGICYIKLKKRLWTLVLAHAYLDTILMTQLYFGSN